MLGGGPAGIFAAIAAGFTAYAALTAIAVMRIHGGAPSK